MKKLLDSILFVVVLIALQLLFLVLGVLVAIYDDSHTSVALLIMVIVFSFGFNILLALTALILKSTKKWYYLGLVLFWILLFASLYFQNFEDEYDVDEIEMEQMIQEYEQLEMDADSIYYLDSIRSVNDSL